jgi:glycosyltransferase involved in cell wall biosynthesis
MKVGIITSYLSSRGGAGLYALQLSEALAALGHEVHVLTEESLDQEIKGMTIDGMRPLFSPFMVKLFQIDPKSFHESIKFIRKYDLDIIHLHEFVSMSLAPILASLAHRIPVVATLHTYWPVCFFNRLCHHDNHSCQGYDRKDCGRCLADQFSQRFKIRVPSVLVERILQGIVRFRRLLLSKINITVPTKTVKEMAMTIGIPEEKIRIIPIGVRIEDFDRKTDAYSVAGLLDPLRGNKLVLFVGRLEKVKGVEFLLKAFPKVLKGVPGSKLLIVGEGKDGTRLSGLSCDLGLENHVIFTGGASKDFLLQCYSLAHVSVIPSISEVGPYVALEAMAMEKPIAASAVGGLQDHVTEENGILVPPASVDDLSEAIIKLLLNPGLAKEKGMAGREIVVKNHTLDGMIAGILDLYHELVQRPPSCED